eukprot:3308453-Pleurochrysis_carterae.AAC.7
MHRRVGDRVVGVGASTVALRRVLRTQWRVLAPLARYVPPECRVGHDSHLGHEQLRSVERHHVGREKGIAHAANVSIRRQQL